MGRGGARAGARRGPPPARLDRLLGLPLVPRDGARIVRRRADRGGHERAVRLREGRPRGAPGHRRDLHGGLPGADRTGRLAAQRVPHARRRSVLRRHLLPARVPPRAPELADGAGRGRRGVVLAPRRHRPPGRAHGRGAERDRAPRAVGRADHAGADPRGAGLAVGQLRPGQRRLRARAEVPAGVGDRVAARARRARDVARDTRGDGPRRDLRPGRWRVRALRGRRDLDRPALREDALRQRAAGPCLPARMAGLRQRAVPAGLHRDARLGAARDARPRGRLLRGARRGLRGRRGQVLRLDGGGTALRAGSVRACRRSHRVLRRDRARQLRGVGSERARGARARAGVVTRDPPAAVRRRGRSASARDSTTSA